MNARSNLPLGVIYDMPMAEYQAVDALSATGLRHFARSPWHFKNRVETAQTKPMLHGSLAHCALLEPLALDQRYVVVPDDAPKRPTPAQWAAKKSNESSMLAKAWWSEFELTASGREVIDASAYAITRMQLDAVARVPELVALLSTGYPEVSIFWIDVDTGVYCKARPDWWHNTQTGVSLLDLKATADESPNGFGRAAARMKYELQMSHYCDGVEYVTDRKVDQFIFAAVTSAPPVLAVPYCLTDEIAEQASDERLELLARFAWCKQSDDWPAYGSGVQLLDYPAYAKRSGEVEVEWSEE